MELQDFIRKFAEQFEETDASKFKATTEFKTLDEWNSLIALAIIAKVDDEYGVVVKGTDIRNANTINDLYELVKSRK